MMYQCLIVDDERPALDLLTAYISNLPHLSLAGRCENAMDALAALQRQDIDMVFLDIQMPEFTGLELLKVLKKRPQVILTTAYREYAIDGFALDVTDYLVKPFSLDRFIQAVNKATEQIQLRHRKPPAFPSPEPEPPPVADHFFVRTNFKMEKVAFADILYISGMREYVGIHTRERRFVVHQSMHKMADELPAARFMRVHRSYIVGLPHIDVINGNTILIGEQDIPIGASYRKDFFERVRLL
ncbi:MAG: response regulator transcription factor [Bacteroidota bacterium]